MSGYPPSGAGQSGSRLLLGPDSPTPKAARPSPPGGRSPQLQVRAAAADTTGRQRQDAECVSGESGRGDGLRPPRAPPPSGSRAELPTSAPARTPKHPRPRRPARQPGAGSGTCRPPTALPRRPSRHPALCSGSFQPPCSLPLLPWGGQRVPGGALPVPEDSEPGPRSRLSRWVPPGFEPPKEGPPLPRQPEGARSGRGGW